MDEFPRHYQNHFATHLGFEHGQIFPSSGMYDYIDPKALAYDGSSDFYARGVFNAPTPTARGQPLLANESWRAEQYRPRLRSEEMRYHGELDDAFHLTPAEMDWMLDTPAGSSSDWRQRGLGYETSRVIDPYPKVDPPPINDAAVLDELEAMTPFLNDNNVRQSRADVATVASSRIRPATCSTITRCEKLEARAQQSSKFAQRYEPEDGLPKLDHSRPWININYNNKGNSSRSAKINTYDPNNVYHPTSPPMRSWMSSSGFLFNYTEDGELADPCFKAQQIKEFIYEHPRTKDCRLRLWIQSAPADSSRRYPYQDSSCCRFEECPMQQLGYSGTITTGHMRVALDERWCKYRDDADPFIVAGYVHLYCLERFLDLPEICRLTNLKVKADDRRLPKEPNGKWAAAIGPVAFGIIKDFISSAERDELLATHPLYPLHDLYPGGVEKPHSATLNAAVQKAKNKPHANRKKYVDKPSNILNTQGDLELYLKHRGNKSKIHLRWIKEEKSRHKRSARMAELSRRQDLSYSTDHQYMLEDHNGEVERSYKRTRYD